MINCVHDSPDPRAEARKRKRPFRWLWQGEGYPRVLPSPGPRGVERSGQHLRMHSSLSRPLSCHFKLFSMDFHQSDLLKM